ncbi:hypothetical protein IE4771_PE00075 (plasmid) [Rhizobium etli bv. mimosae str. IE4771]|uniref:Uncharacterized protein n=1 Tax=Rhizobium etli bv. mimosae str. IE4771 TaxID=1432050 RepID=A0A060II76_RHIET|nr:hypothetical protein IE4771_PE00075 [Rhizobium sp. IE4771]
MPVTAADFGHSHWLIELSHFVDACASLWIDGELVHLEDLVLHDAGLDIRVPTHELIIARDVLRTRRRIVAHPVRLGVHPGRLTPPARAGRKRGRRAA